MTGYFGVAFIKTVIHNEIDVKLFFLKQNDNKSLSSTAEAILKLIYLDVVQWCFSFQIEFNKPIDNL